MKAWKDILYTVVGISPAIGALIVYNELPETVATHFSVNNEVNGTMNKGIFILVLVLLGLVPLLMRVMRAVDPKRDNFNNFSTAFEVKRLGATLVLAIAGWTALIYNLGHAIDIRRIIMIAIGVLFLVMGNYLTQVKPNYTFGIRTPWTLASEENWRKTHRIGGPFMMLGGLVALLCTFAEGRTALLGFVGMIIVCSLIPTVYSYWLFTRMKK
ncbi:putative membrane protein [Paenibacillus taihuensis]|uniref:Putative membrane protein n=1 Tax=Paenibacillus taihuensis TaxID=1156355 RepID=A0A3D9RIP3_9BACL|nr:SdpI family protein [Paenibacillus taihuensis]REE78959.1 putative membrane protein [Paenibacillus taihuensis]